MATKFSQATALKALGGPGKPIENTIKGMSAAFKTILIAHELEVNEIEMTRWCEFQWNRKYHMIPKGAEATIKKTLTAESIIANFRTYMRNWYETHCKWLRANS